MPKIDRSALNKTAHQTAHLDLSNRIDPLLRRADVLRVTGLSQSALYRLMRDGDFPTAVQITDSTVGWRQSDLIGWINTRPQVSV